MECIDFIVSRFLLHIISQNTYDEIKEFICFNCWNIERFVAANPSNTSIKTYVMKSKKFINIHNNYAVTYKADGERNFLIVHR